LRLRYQKLLLTCPTRDAIPRDRTAFDRSVDEHTTRRRRGKSRIREPARGGRQSSYTESDRDHRQVYSDNNLRYADEPDGAYFDSSGQVSASYQPHEVFEHSSPSRVFSSPQPRHLSPRPFDPGTGDPLADKFGALHVDEHYTTSSTSATRDWQTPAVSTRYEETTFPSSNRDNSQQIYPSPEYHAEEPLPAVETQQPQLGRVVKGTAGNSERIDSSYKVRNRDYKEFFRIGRVFSTLWTDALGNNAGKVDPTFVSEVLYGERVYSKIRRFIVVREGERSVSCLPVTSYANEGIRKSGIRLDEHGFIYSSSRNKPRKIDGMCSRPLKLTLASGAAHLKDPSLVNVRHTFVLICESFWVARGGDLFRNQPYILFSLLMPWTSTTLLTAPRICSADYLRSMAKCTMSRPM
jgi:hypothetical protein